MLSVKRYRRWFFMISGAIAAGALVGGVVDAQSRDASVPATVESSLLNDPLIRVADIPGANGHSRRGVFVQEASAGFVCVWEAPNATSQARRGACNRADDPLGGKAVSVNFTYEGGPAIAAVTDARLFGLAGGAVAEAEVVMSDGSRRSLTLRPVAVASKRLQAFGYRFNSRDFREGVTPTAVTAFDASGNELDRQATGF